MYEKLQSIVDKFNELKNLLRFLFAFTIIWMFLILNFMTTKPVNEALNYPEETYMALEIEANRIVINHDFNTEYNATITYYNNVSNSLIFNLEDKSGTDAKVQVNVTNYGKCNQEMSIERYIKNADGFAIYVVISTIGMAVLFSLITIFVIMLTMILLTGVLYIIKTLKMESK